MSIQSVFAGNMRRYRKAAGLTQEGLAERSGLHRTYIGGIEQKRINISIKNAERIAVALGINPALLFVEYESDDIIKHQMECAESMQQRAPEDDEAIGELYGLCTCTPKSVMMQRVEVENIDLTVQILCALIANGCRRENLAHEYHRTKGDVVNFLAEHARKRTYNHS